MRFENSLAPMATDPATAHGIGTSHTWTVEAATYNAAIALLERATEGLPLRGCSFEVDLEPREAHTVTF